MVSFYGDYDLTETVNIPFNTFSSNDPSASVTVTNLANGDVYVHQDGVEGTPGGITVSLNVGTVNGNHLAILNLTNTDDAGFYAVGSRYQVRMEGVTIDGATVNAWIGTFSIGCTLRPTTAGRKLDVTATGAAGIDWANVENKTTANDLTGTNIKTDQKVDVNTIKTQAVTCGAGVTVGVYVGSTAAASVHTAANVYTAFGTGGNLTTCATATGFSTHTAANVYTAFGTGANLTTCATATGFATTGADSDTLETLSDQIDGIEGGTGSGARSVTITVNDGSDALENATVRFTEGGNTYAGSTNVSGVVAFSLDDATYAVTIAKAGYTFTPTTMIVNGTETETYSMSSISISAPPSATTTTGVMTVYDEEMSAESGVSVSVQIIDGPGTAGIGYDSAVWTETSNNSGVVSFAGIAHGAQYRLWRGDSKADSETFTAPTTGDSFSLKEVIGMG